MADRALPLTLAEEFVLRAALDDRRRVLAQWPDLVDEACVIDRITQKLAGELTAMNAVSARLSTLVEKLSGV